MYYMGEQKMCSILWQNSQYILKLTHLLAIVFMIICNDMRIIWKWPNIERFIGLADISVSVTICFLTAKPNWKQNELKMWKPHMHDIRAEYVFNLVTFDNNCSMNIYEWFHNISWLYIKNISSSYCGGNYLIWTLFNVTS